MITFLKDIEEFANAIDSKKKNMIENQNFRDVLKELGLSNLSSFKSYPKELPRNPEQHIKAVIAKTIINVWIKNKANITEDQVPILTKYLSF